MIRIEYPIVKKQSFGVLQVGEFFLFPKEKFLNQKVPGGYISYNEHGSPLFIKGEDLALSTREIVPTDVTITVDNQ